MPLVAALTAPSFSNLLHKQGGHRPHTVDSFSMFKPVFLRLLRETNEWSVNKTCHEMSDC